MTPPFDLTRFTCTHESRHPVYARNVRKRRQTGSPAIAYGDLRMCDRSQRIGDVLALRERGSSRSRRILGRSRYAKKARLAFIAGDFLNA